jgi:hypothetical protein
VVVRIEQCGDAKADVLVAATGVSHELGTFTDTEHDSAVEDIPDTPPLFGTERVHGVIRFRGF